MILYINNKICQRIEDLRKVFSATLDEKSDLYKDLLEAGKFGDVSRWLREIGEIKVANAVDEISENLEGTDYMQKLSSALGVDFKFHKRPLLQCVSVESENTECIYTDKKIFIIFRFKMLDELDDSYELQIKGNSISSKHIWILKDYKKNQSYQYKITIPRHAETKVEDFTVSFNEECLLTIKKHIVKHRKDLSCKVVVKDIISKTHVTTRDIATIREIVMKEKRATFDALNDDNLILMAGDVFQEMMYLYEYLGVETKNNKTLKNDEVWYMSEWLKKKCPYDLSVRKRNQKVLSDFLGRNIFWLATEAEHLDNLIKSES